MINLIFFPSNCGYIQWIQKKMLLITQEMFCNAEKVNGLPIFKMIVLFLLQQLTRSHSWHQLDTHNMLLIIPSCFSCSFPLYGGDLAFLEVWMHSPRFSMALSLGSVECGQTISWNATHIPKAIMAQIHVSRKMASLFESWLKTQICARSRTATPIYGPWT